MASLFVCFGEVIYISMQQSDVFGGEKVFFFYFVMAIFLFFYFLNIVAPKASRGADGFHFHELSLGSEGRTGHCAYCFFKSPSLILLYSHNPLVNVPPPLVQSLIIWMFVSEWSIMAPIWGLFTLILHGLGTAQGFRSFVYGVDWTMFHVGGQRA